MRARNESRATVRDVAAHAGVSVATVSRILNSTYTAPPATYDRVMAAVDLLGYRATMTTALSGLHGSVAVAMPHLRSGYYTAIAAGIEAQVRAAGMAVLIGATDNSPARELAFIDSMRKRGVEAIIVMGAIAGDTEHEATIVEQAEAAHRAGVRLVLCGRAWGGPPDAPLAVVNYDAEAAAHAMTTYLLSAGHRRIGHLAGPTNYGTSRARQRGYLRALEEFGVTPEDNWIISTSMDRDAGLLAGRRLVREDVTAIFAANDEVAAGVLAAAREIGRRVPEDLSVVGFDDIAMARDLHPGLTTLHIPTGEMGRAAARLALYADGERRVEIGTHVVVRESVAPPADRSPATVV